MITIKHVTGDTYEGKVVDSDVHRIWVKVSTGKIFCIWRADIKEMT